MRWKKILVSGLGGFLVGGAALLVTKRKRKSKEANLERIPEDTELVRIETEPMKLVYREEPYLSYALYTCAPTSFKVWSFLKGIPTKAKPAQSQRIYHITPEVHFRSLQQEDHREVLAEEKFYATLHAHSMQPQQTLPDHIACGHHLEFRKCHVGGSMNGVETGDKIVTMAPVVKYEIRRRAD